MPKGYAKKGINKGWFKKRTSNSKKTEFKKNHKPWNKGDGNYMKGEQNHFYGKKHTNETKKINKQKHLGKKHTLKTKTQMSKSRMGHITTEKTRKKIGLANKLEKNGMWLGGKSYEPYGIEFNKQLKNLIKERDNHKCQICFKKGKVIHHIDYNKQNNTLKNLILLCQFCHGKTNQNRKEWTKLFKRKFK